MCNSLRLICRVKSGELCFCEGCNSYHLIFNNLFFALNSAELERLKSYIDTIEVDYWENRYSCARLIRKIPLPSRQDNLVIMFNRKELKELRILLAATGQKKSNNISFLKAEDIDYDVTFS